MKYHIKFVQLFFILIAICSINSKAYSEDITTLAPSAVLMDANSKQVLFEKESDISIPPASMSKMMTMYLVFEALKKGDIKLTDEFVISENAWKQEGSRMFVQVGDSVSVDNLLRGAIIQSGNDACVALAEGVAGSVEAFVNNMNEVAQKIGLMNSSFMNPTGLPDPNHRMSVKDLALLGRQLVYDFPEYYKIYSEKEFTWNKIKQGNRNPLLYYFNGADGIKTGHTEEAGYGLVGSAKRGDMRLISVVSGLASDKDRRLESVKILGYGFANYQAVTIKSSHVFANIPVFWGRNETVPVSLEKDLSLLVKKSDQNAISAKISYETPIVAPIKKGTKLGKIIVSVPNQAQPIIADIIAGADVEKIGFFSRIIENFKILISGTPNFSSTQNIVVADDKAK